MESALDDLLVLGGLFAGVWALSLAFLVRIRSDKSGAEEELKDAAGAAILALHAIAGGAAAAALGWNISSKLSDAILAVLIFLIPFAAMGMVYTYKKRPSRKYLCLIYPIAVGILIVVWGIGTGIGWFEVK